MQVCAIYQCLECGQYSVWNIDDAPVTVPVCPECHHVMKHIATIDPAIILQRMLNEGENNEN